MPFMNAPLPEGSYTLGGKNPSDQLSYVRLDLVVFHGQLRWSLVEMLYPVLLVLPAHVSDRQISNADH